MEAPADVKQKWDYIVKETIPADEAFQPLSTSIEVQDGGAVGLRHGAT